MTLENQPKSIKRC